MTAVSCAVVYCVLQSVALIALCRIETIPHISFSQVLPSFLPLVVCIHWKLHRMWCHLLDLTDACRTSPGISRIFSSLWYLWISHSPWIWWRLDWFWGRGGVITINSIIHYLSVFYFLVHITRANKCIMHAWGFGVSFWYICDIVTVLDNVFLTLSLRW